LNFWRLPFTVYRLTAFTVYRFAAFAVYRLSTKISIVIGVKRQTINDKIKMPFVVYRLSFTVCRLPSVIVIGPCHLSPTKAVSTADDCVNVCVCVFVVAV
jgi:hypothetical protein